MTTFRTANFSRLLRRFRNNDCGYVIVMAAVLMVPVAGVIALVIDLSRQQDTHTELQSILDAAALAGAKKLDGTVDAITYATTAAQAVVTKAYEANQPRFSDGTIGTLSLKFFKGLMCDEETTAPGAAACIQVTSEQHTLSATFASVLGYSNLQTQASATAESRYVACAVQPLMICSPWGSEFNLMAGQMVRLKPKSGASNVLPGDFGLLDPPGQTTAGAPITGLHLAQSSPNFCYTNEVSVNTGGTTSAINDGIGARFGFYDKGDKDALWNEKPAPNTIKGMKPKITAKAPYCKTQDFDVFKDWQVPRDTCLPPVGASASVTGTCPNSTTNLLIGDGNWSAKASTYWSSHHKGSMPAGLGLPTHANYITRYKLYLNELGCDSNGENCTGTPNAGYEFNDPPAESMAPLCNTPGTADRRIIYVSVVDCSAQTQQVSGSGTKTTVRGNKLAKFFLPEPPDNGEIYAEFVELITVENDDGKLRHVVQLVRR